MALVSVVVPVYNVEKYVEKCIVSILNQSFTNFELIIIDDGSTDDSYNICKKYVQKDKRIRLIHKNNTGLVPSWKLGVKESHSEYIVFIDSDDYIEKDYLKELYDCYKKYKVQIVIAPTKKYVNNKLVNLKYKVKPGLYDYTEYKKDILPKILNDGGLFQSRILLPNRWGKLIPRDLILCKMKYVDNKSTYAEDLSLLIPIFLDIKSIYLIEAPNASYIYRIRNGSMVRGYDKNRWKSVKLVYKNLYSALRSSNAGNNLYDQLSLDYYSALIQCYKNEIKNPYFNCKSVFSIVVEMRNYFPLLKRKIDTNNFGRLNNFILNKILYGKKLDNYLLFLFLRMGYVLKSRKKK